MKLSEAIHNGLTNLGNSIDRATDKQMEWERENREIGLLPDGEKLRLSQIQALPRCAERVRTRQN